MISHTMPKALRRMLVFTAFSVSLTASAHYPAMAQTEPGALSTEAQDDMQRGLDAAANQDWGLAAENFAKACNHDLSDRRNAGFYSRDFPTYCRNFDVIFNLALALDRKGGSDLRAIALYYAYLSSNSDTPNAAAIRARIADLEMRIESASKRIAEALLDLALKFGIEHEDGRNAGMGVIDAYVWMADTRAAHDWIDQFTYGKPLMKRHALRNMGRALVSKGDFSGAFSIVDNFSQLQVDSSEERFELLGNIASSQYKSGDVEDALKTMNRAEGAFAELMEREESSPFAIPHPHDLDWEKLAMFQGNVGRVADAKNTANRIKDDQTREQTLAKIEINYESHNSPQPIELDEFDEWMRLSFHSGPDYEQVAKDSEIAMEESITRAVVVLKDAARDPMVHLKKLRDTEAKWLLMRSPN